MVRYLVIAFSTFILGAALGYFFSGTSQNKNAEYYLSQSIKDIANVDLHKRNSFVSQSPLFSGFEAIDSLSSSDQRYYLYDITPEGLHRYKITDSGILLNNNFYGFFVILDAEGVILDFGFHKP